MSHSNPKFHVAFLLGKRGRSGNFQENLKENTPSLGSVKLVSLYRLRCFYILSLNISHEIWDFWWSKLLEWWIQFQCVYESSLKWSVYKKRPWFSSKTNSNRPSAISKKSTGKSQSTFAFPQFSHGKYNKHGSSSVVMWGFCLSFCIFFGGAGIPEASLCSMYTFAKIYQALSTQEKTNTYVIIDNSS